MSYPLTRLTPEQYEEIETAAGNANERMQETAAALRDACGAAERAIAERLALWVRAYDHNSELDGDRYLAAEAEQNRSTWSVGSDNPTNILETMTRRAAIKLLAERVNRRAYRSRTDTRPDAGALFEALRDIAGTARGVKGDNADAVRTALKTIADLATDMVKKVQA